MTSTLDPTTPPNVPVKGNETASFSKVQPVDSQTSLIPDGPDDKKSGESEKKHPLILAPFYGIKTFYDVM